MPSRYQIDRDNFKRGQHLREWSTMYLEPRSSNPEEDVRLAEQAKNFPITRLPYAGEPKHLKFDRRSSRPFKRAPLNTTNAIGRAGLSYADFQGGMHIVSRASANEMRLLYTPLFSAKDDLLQLVVAQQTYNYIQACGGGVLRERSLRHIPNSLLQNREELEWLAKKTTNAMKFVVPKAQELNWYRHILWCETHGGYLALRASVAYRAWRLAKDAHTISDEMGLSHHGVRQILHRLCKTALRLGFETFPPHHSAYSERDRRPYDFGKPLNIELYKEADVEDEVLISRIDSVLQAGACLHA